MFDLVGMSPLRAAHELSVDESSPKPALEVAFDNVNQLDLVPAAMSQICVGSGPPGTV